MLIGQNRQTIKYNPFLLILTLKRATIQNNIPIKKTTAATIIDIVYRNILTYLLYNIYAKFNSTTYSVFYPIFFSENNGQKEKIDYSISPKYFK